MLLLKEQAQKLESRSQSPVSDIDSEHAKDPVSLIQDEEESGGSMIGPRPTPKDQPIWAIPTSSVPATIQSWDSDVWVSVQCSDSHQPLVTQRHGDSCDGRIEASSSHPPNQETDSFLAKTEKNLERRNLEASGQVSVSNEVRFPQRETPTVDRTDSPSSELNDDGDDIFDTPIRNLHDIQTQCTPLTPPSSYATPSTWLGDDKSSPTKARSSRPGPEPLQDVKEGMETRSRGRKTVHQLGKDQSKASKTPVESYIPNARSRSREKCIKRVEEESSQTSIEIKVEEGKLNDHDIHTEAQTYPSNPRGKLAELLIGIFGSDILDHIEQVRNRCVALTKSSNRKNRCKLCLMHDDSATQEHLHSLQKWLSLQVCIKELKALIELVFCYHHRDQAKERAVDWLLNYRGVAIIQEIVKDANGTDTVSVSNQEITGLFNAKTLDMIPQFDTSFACNTDFQSSNSVKPHKQRRTTARTHILWQPRATASLSVLHSLSKEIIKPLTVKELKSGYLYGYTTSGEIGLRKIGVTKNEDIKERLRGACGKCQLDAVAFYPPENQRVPVKHVYRLEKLVHTELKDMRKKTMNCGCGVHHREWFDVKDDKHIIEVIRRWTAWLQTDPYENSDGIWLLKGLFEKIEPMCKPYVPPAEIARPNHTGKNRSFRQKDGGSRIVRRK